MSRMLATLGCAIVATGLLACDHARWHVGDRVRARDADVAAALGDTASQASLGLEPADIPDIAFPRALRPCCAFGVDLKVELHHVLIPGVELANIVDPDNLGRHRYDNGYLSMRADDPRGIVDDEGNGLVYTCRGGVIDVAHVRDNADNTIAIGAALARGPETGTTLTVPPQRGAIRIRLVRFRRTRSDAENARVFGAGADAP